MVLGENVSDDVYGTFCMESESSVERRTLGVSQTWGRGTTLWSGKYIEIPLETGHNPLRKQFPERMKTQHASHG